MSLSGFEKINRLTAEKAPFLCLIDFDKANPLVFTLAEIDPDSLMYSLNGKSNIPDSSAPVHLHEWNFQPVSRSRYQQAFDLVQHHLFHGDSFLLNLTFPTRLQTNLGLKDILYASQAKYKVWLKDQFVTFSPEPFIRISEGIVSSFPMKGTIRSNTPDAENAILNNLKEKEEHLTIVDLIRNDLSIIATDIQVAQFRYVEEVKTSRANLLQVSSKITGKVQPAYWPNLGSLLVKILPAGSISGAPKKKTLEIIKQAEGYQRGFFTGIVGLFDGASFDSGVMIRFVERTEDGPVYKSGGGITVNSECELEYQEMIDKVYVPVI